MTEIPKPNQIYRHFKGNLYRIVTLATHSETGGQLVIYQALYGDYTVYARELSMFMSKVDRKKYPDAQQEDRFVLLPQIVGQETAAAGVQPQESEVAHPQSAETMVRPAHNNAPAEEPAPPQPQHEKAAHPQSAETMVRPAHNNAPAEEPAPPQPQESEAAQEAVLQQQEKDTAMPEEAETALDPFLLQFLDADTYREKLGLLAALRPRITDDMINTMAVSLDVEVNDGELDDRYEALKTCLLTMERYECSRLR